MPATKVNISGINELDLNLPGTTTATTSQGVTTVNYTPAVATNTTVGVVKPDNLTVQVAADGTLTAAGPAPTFVQGASNTSVSSTMLVSLSGITLANSLILQIRTGSSSPPTFSGIGNPYVLIHSLYNSFWTTGVYTYICYGALATTESITVTGLSGGGSCLLAEYTPAAGFEAIADNGVSANANNNSTLSITSTKSFERALFIFTCGAFSGQTPNQTQRVPTSGSGTVLLMDAPAQASGTTITGTVTSGAMNQSSITGFFLSSLGVVQSVGLSMPSDFTVTGSPVTSTGLLQVTGGATKSGIQQNAYSYSADTGAANAYAITLTPAPTLVVGSEIIFKAANTNTGASTVTVNGTTYPLKKNGTNALSSGDIVVNQIVTAFFDGTNFQMLVPGSGGGGGGVTSLNTLTGGLTLVAGSNVTITPSGTNITIASTGGGGGTSAIVSKQNFTSVTRALGTVYQNTGTYPIVVLYTDTAATAPIGFSDTVNPPTKVVAQLQTYTSTAAQPLMFLVMPGNFYKVTGTSWAGWMEYTFNTGTWTDSGDLNAGTRVLGTVYQNTGSGAMFVTVMTSNTTATNVLSVVCDANTSPTTTTFSQQTVSTAGNTIMFIVPQGYYYKLACTGTPTVAHWHEYSSNIAATATVNLITTNPARRAIASSNSNPVAAWSVFNSSGKTKWLQTGYTNGSTGTAICASDECCPPVWTVFSSSALGGSQIRSQGGFHNPNEFWYTKQDGGTCTASFWLEYTLG